jgi:hypothetical protein
MEEEERDQAFDNARMSTRQIHFLQMFFVAEELKTRI